LKPLDLLLSPSMPPLISPSTSQWTTAPVITQVLLPLQETEYGTPQDI
jgi:hypothetical protein